MAGFNKMFVMLPVMFLARKLDGEDPNTVLLLQVAYFFVQSVIIAIVAYIYYQATILAERKSSEHTIFVPPPPQPFDDPSAKKKYTEAQFGEHVLSQAKSLGLSTVGGTIFTIGLHAWKGMVMGLAMQCVMGPMNLIESPLVKGVLLDGGIDTIMTKKVFGEKKREELTDDDEVVNKEGEVVEIAGKGAAASLPSATTNEESKDERSFEDILLDTWDAGAEADIRPLMAALNETNINYKTSESGWTPLMIMASIGVKGTVSALKQMKALGADPTIVDEEGWNALHWAAFHGSVDGAKTLLVESGFNGKASGLYKVKDKEGKQPLQHAKSEGNTLVAKAMEKIIEGASEVAKPTASEGLRKRK